MSVNLSPLGGAGAQFFSNNGVPLAGGLLYTYIAGTSTPATTYNSSSGITPLPNPIILDSAGRVPTGEIWLSDGISYKFVLKDATDVLIATWDNLSGINSNFISYTSQQQTITATAGQTVFDLTIDYVPGANNLAVYVNGSKQIVTTNYTETDSNTVTFLTGLNVGDLVQVSTATPVATNATTAANVSYTPAGASAVTTTVQTKLRETVSIDDFGADPTGVADSYSAIQAALAYAMPLSLNVIGTGKYKSSQTILIPTYRTTPPVTLDFVVMNFTINQLTYTAITGAAIQVESPAATVYVKKLIGPGGSTVTSGLKITGQGDPEHRVDYVTGFGTNVDLLNAYSHTVWIGYCQDADVGVLLTNCNHIKIYGGRIGGQFTSGATATDATTCGTGVKIIGGTANEVHATIEYCKRTSSSVGLYDQGTATYYIGYLESSALWNIYAIGSGGRYFSVTDTNRGPSGVYLEGDNEFFLTNQKVQSQVTPIGSNTTLAFDTPSKFETEGFAKINGVQGYTEQQITATTSVRNEIFYSSDLTNAAWVKSIIGSANWGAVTITANQAGFIEAGYESATRFIFPALPATNDIYRLGQSSRTTQIGPLNYGFWIWVESGDIDVQVRILEITNNVQSKQVVRLGASNKWVNVAAKYMKTSANASDVLFELQFRTTVGATVRIANAYLVNDAEVFFAPTNRANIYKNNIKGLAVNGNSFDQGVRINGALQNQIAPAVTTASEYLLEKGNYPVYIVSGGWTGNLFLADANYNGQRIVIKRDGVAATGVMQLLPVGTIDGSSAAISIATIYTYLELIYSTVAGGWLRIN